MAFSVAAQTKKADVQSEPRMANIGTYGTELSISGGGVASISGFVRGKSGCSGQAFL